MSDDSFFAAPRPDSSRPDATGSAAGRPETSATGTSTATISSDDPLYPYDAVVVASFGGPHNNDEVMPFLEHVSGGRIPPARLQAVAEHYYRMDGMSPINPATDQLVDALRQAVVQTGSAVPLVLGNRHGTPFLSDVLRQLRDEGARRILMVPTTAFSSYSGCRQYREDAASALAEAGVTDMTIDMLPPFHEAPGFSTANAHAVMNAFSQIPPTPLQATRVVFVTHSIPQGMQDASGNGRPGSDYVTQHMQVASHVADLVHQSFGNMPSWDLAYCSRSGRPSDPWLEPDINDYLRTLPGQGVTSVVICPLGFVTDHMEVVNDLDVEASRTARELGLSVARSATVGTHPSLIADIVIFMRARAAQALGKGQVPGSWPSPCMAGCCLRGDGSPCRPAISGSDELPQESTSMDHDDAPARARVDHRDDAPSQGGSHAIGGPRASAESGHSSEAAAEPAADPSARSAAGSQADPAPIPVVALAGEAAPAGRKLTDEPAPASGDDSASAASTPSTPARSADHVDEDENDVVVAPARAASEHDLPGRAERLSQEPAGQGAPESAGQGAPHEVVTDHPTASDEVPEGSYTEPTDPRDHSVIPAEVNQASLWAMYSVFKVSEPLPASGDRRAAIVSESTAWVDESGVATRGWYDLGGLRADADVLVWWTADTPEALQDAYHRLRGSALGAYLEPVWSSLAVHRPAEFNKRHLPSCFAGVAPRRWAAFYPFVRTKDWYLLDPAERSTMLREHGIAGARSTDVKASTLASFALGDYEWILALEGDDLSRVVDVMKDLRYVEARRYVAIDIPFYTGERVEPQVWADRQQHR
ncbi:hydrogen peroxide-dependent heme synthase [Cutibacterium granulosum]|uniref:hydrogen peroxide-dependent heme synthase n=1 Tax=Cutibacterium granulosum TaxID=33011 RepID=UPI002B22B26A|nr:hydrogen peroxide-dependent heme synthase [Cutibacterium granulosum]MEA5650193.1 hydrogen peroxide-dependent heme synthase [Cutibacterium granulosum]